jgi:hypothetical protein
MGKLQGPSSAAAAADICRNSIDTNGVTATAGFLVGIQNNAANKLRVDYEGRFVLDVGTVAAAGSAQGDAAALTDPFTYVTASDGTKGVILPVVAQAGVVMFVYDSVATSGVKVYPGTGCTINGGSANASVTMEGKTLAVFVAQSATNWAAIFTAN